MAYLPLSFIVSRADIARSAGMPRDLSTLIAMVSLGNSARRYRSKNSFSGSVQNLSHFRLAERHPALAHAVMAPLICWSFSNSMFRYRLVDHAVPAMWRSLAAARLSAD